MARIRTLMWQRLRVALLESVHRRRKGWRLWIETLARSIGVAVRMKVIRCVGIVQGIASFQLSSQCIDFPKNSSTENDSNECDRNFALHIQG